MTDVDADTAPCSKCGSEIPVSAGRCSACGYEPGSSILLRLAFWLLAVPPLAFIGFFVFVTTAGMFILPGEITLLEYSGGLLGFGILGAIPAAIAFYYVRRRRRGPTD
jgi:hypothetical protein